MQFWGSFIFLVVLMNLWRLIFMVSEYPFLSIKNGWLYLSAFFVGFRLDAVVASYLTIPIGLLLILKMFWRKEGLLKKVLYAYLIFVSFCISLVNLVDIFTFMEMNSHLNYLTVRSYVTQKDSMAFIFEEYPVFWAILILLFFSWLVFRVYRKGYSSMRDRHSSPGKKIAGAILTVILLGTAIRGGWQERPIDWGHAMFSQDFLSNQIALNGLFLFGRSAVQFSSENKIPDMVNFYDEAKAFGVTRDLIKTSDADFVDDHSLIRRNHAAEPKDYNVVLVLLESHTGLFCGYMNEGTPSITPNLDRLAKEGVAFTNCYANGKRSAHGIGSTLMSWPTLPGLPLISRVESVGNVPCLGTSLRDLGYETLFMYGGDPQFDNMKGFVKANGFDRVIERKDFSPDDEGTKWGVYDHYVFRRMLKELDEVQKPAFLTVFTTTNHQPWKFPASYETQVGPVSDTLYHKGLVHRTMSYVDHVIGEFMEQASQRDWYEQTIFVFIADHGLPIIKDRLENIRNANIPFVIFAPGLSLEPEIIDRPVSQVDVAPTILGLINYQKPYYFFGQNVLSSDSTFACRITEDEGYWLEDNYLYTERFGQEANLYKIAYPIQANSELVPPTSPLFSHYQEHFRAYIQTGASLFKGFKPSLK